MKNQWLQKKRISLTGDDILYVSNVCPKGAVRLHLKNGDHVDVRGTADEIADVINALFVRGRDEKPMAGS